MTVERKLVRVTLDGERSWAEHVEGTVYRSLNNTLTEVPVRYPVGHGLAVHNGERKPLLWGDLFEAAVIGLCEGVRPIVIVGNDMTPRSSPAE